MENATSPGTPTLQLAANAGQSSRFQGDVLVADRASAGSILLFKLFNVREQTGDRGPVSGRQGGAVIGPTGIDGQQRAAWGRGSLFAYIRPRCPVPHVIEPFLRLMW